MKGERGLPFCWVQMTSTGAALGRSMISRVLVLMMAGGWVRALCKTLLTGGAYHSTWGQEAGERVLGQPGPACHGFLGLCLCCLWQGSARLRAREACSCPVAQTGPDSAKLFGARLGQVQT